jgi:hypothetical protein
MQFEPVIQVVQMHVVPSNSDEKTTANKQAASMRGKSVRKVVGSNENDNESQR